MKSAYSLPLLLLVFSACQGHKDKQVANPQPTATPTPIPDTINWMQLALLEDFDFSNRTLTSQETKTFDSDGKLFSKTTSQYNAQGLATEIANESSSPSRTTNVYDPQGKLLSSESFGQYGDVKSTTTTKQTYDAHGFELTSESRSTSFNLKTKVETETARSSRTWAYDDQHRIVERSNIWTYNETPKYSRQKHNYQYAAQGMTISSEGCSVATASACDEAGNLRKAQSVAEMNEQGQLVHLLTNDLSGAEPRPLVETKVDWTKKDFKTLDLDTSEDLFLWTINTSVEVTGIDQLKARTADETQACLRRNAGMHSGYCFVEIASDIWDDFLDASRPAQVLTDPFLKDMVQARSYSYYGTKDALKDIAMTRNCDINEENHRHCHTQERLTEKGEQDRVVEHDFTLKKVESGWELRYATASDKIEEVNVLQFDQNKRYVSSKQDLHDTTVKDKRDIMNCGRGYDKSTTKVVWDACELNGKARALTIYNY